MIGKRWIAQLNAVDYAEYLGLQRLFYALQYSEY